MSEESSNQNEPCSTEQLNILVIADDKAGHQNQSLGLAQAIERYRPISLEIVDPLNASEVMFCNLTKQPPKKWRQISPPDLIISTGSGTHLSLLTAGRLYPQSYTTLLCSSLYPASWFDLNPVPEHDNRRPAPNVIATKGVLNKVVPAHRPVPNYGLMLVGGESKHYRWNSRSIIRQIKAIQEQAPGTEWHITNSRRTPKDFESLLKKRIPNSRFHRWQDTQGNWLPEQLTKAEKIWVTPDSVSMVYESLTSGNQVYLFRLRSRYTRVAIGIEALRGHETGHIDNKLIVPPTRQEPLWEADRVARAILQQLAQ